MDNDSVPEVYIDENIYSLGRKIIRPNEEKAMKKKIRLNIGKNIIPNEIIIKNKKKKQLLT